MATRRTAEEQEPSEQSEQPKTRTRAAASSGSDKQPRQRTQNRTRSSSGTQEGAPERTSRSTTRRSSGTAASEKTAQAGEERSQARTDGERPSDRGRRAETAAGESSDRRQRLSASNAARLAMQQVMELAGRHPESVTSLERGEQGWRVGVEVVETRRIPDSADILAVYDTELDEDGELLSYRRTQRYPRGHSQE